MIWYRHWLEMRWWLLPFVGFVVVGAYLDALHRGPVSPDDAMEWFAVRVWLIGYMAAFFIGGCGLRGLWLHAHPSTYFTLSLPTARERIVLTRIAATLSAAVLIDVLAAGFTVVWLGGLPGSLAAVNLLELFVVSLPVLFGYVAFSAALSCFLHPFWYVLASVAVGVVLAVLLLRPLGAPGTGDALSMAQWLVAGIFALLGAVAVALTLRYGTRREY